MQEVLGTDIAAVPVEPGVLRNFPLYISENYRAYDASLFKHYFLLIELKNEQAFSIAQIEKHLHMLRDSFNQSVVLLCNDISSITRKRLIEKGINFIVPGNQLYLPDFFIDLRERFQNARSEHKTVQLLPSAQFLLIYHILHRYEKWKIEEHSFKEIAEHTGYTAMAVTKAVENLKHHELIEVRGAKEKKIRFNLERHELWNVSMQQNLLVNPVIRTVYVDERPEDVFLLMSNASALSEYSDMNPSRQLYCAIEKNIFYGLLKSNLFKNLNEHEGKYGIEVWKYNPEKLVAEMPNERSVVDPLSLYLSLKNSHDERIEMAREQIIEKFIW